MSLIKTRAERWIQWTLVVLGLGSSIAMSEQAGAMNLKVARCEGYSNAYRGMGSSAGVEDSRRVISVQRDSQRHSRWALTVDCAHPEWPPRMALVDVGDLGSSMPGVAETSGARAPEPSAMLVRAGDKVQVWMRDAVVSLETTGVAEESGAAGMRIRVRLAPQGVSMESGASPGLQHVTGRVTGDGRVEMIP